MNGSAGHIGQKGGADQLKYRFFSEVRRRIAKKMKTIAKLPIKRVDFIVEGGYLSSRFR